MADETTITITHKCVKGGVLRFSHTKTYTQDMVGDDTLFGTQLIGTSAEALVFGEISGAPEGLEVENLDAANFVDLSYNADGSAPFEKLKAGRSCLIHPTSANVYAKADTAAVRVLISASEA